MSKCPQPVVPGLCPSDGCPPYDRIECILVEKVYDSCFQIDERTRDITIGIEWPTGPFAVGDFVGCAVTEGADISCTELDRIPTNEPGLFTVTLAISVPVTLTNPNAIGETVDTIFTFTKTVTLCAPEGTNINCDDSALLYCNCMITNVGVDSVIVTCDIQVCVVIRSTLVVQLLVPSYGFCVPAPCVTLPGACPPMPPTQCL